MINEDKKDTCHPELVSGSHKEVGSQHKEEILKRVQHDMNGKFLVPQYLSALVPLKKPAFTKPSRATNEVRDELATTETLSFRCKSERWRLMRGAVAKSSKKVAFTLAEVLITLGIIGIVAAMTMPSLIQKHEQKVLLNQFKKTYAVLNQAVLSMRAKYDNVDPVDMPFVHSVWTHRAYLDTTLFGPEFAEHIEVLWHGRDPQTRLCFPDISKFNYKYKNGNSILPGYFITQTANNYTWQLKNGACVEFAYGTNWEWDGHDKRRFVIDVNGSNKGPNRLGRDVYVLNFEPNGKILPYGSDNTEANQYNNCRNGGYTCAALIINNGWQYPKNYPW